MSTTTASILKDMVKPHAHPWKYGWALAWVSASVILLYLTSNYSYLLFHNLAEIFSMTVAGAIFMIAWNSRRYQNNDYFLFLGIALVFVGGLDMMHMLAYKGMGVLDKGTTNTSSQLWVSARYLESFSLLISPIFFKRTLKPGMALLAFTAGAAVILASIFVWEIFPACYSPGIGLTPFKKVSELVVTLLFVFAMILTTRRRSEFSPRVFNLMFLFIFFRVFAELSFTFYTDVYGILNFSGHLLKVAAYYVLYRAIIETGITKPYDLIFRSQKKTEDALNKALAESQTERSNWQAVFEAAPFGIALLDRQYHVIQSNESLKGMFDFSAGDAKEQQLGNALKCVGSFDNPKGCGYGPECSQCHIRAALEKEIPRGETVRGKEILKTFMINGKDTARWLSLNAKPVIIGGENSIIVTIEDISERKRLEQVKSQFLGVVSHELRTPLTSIMGSLGLIKGGAAGILPENAFKMIDIAHRNSKRLTHLINDFLDIEKINSGKMPFNFQPMDLVSVVEQTIELMTGYADRYEVKFEAKNNLSGKAMVNADGDRLGQVIINLLSNAAKFSPPGGIVEISVAREGPFIRTSITDHGPAINKAFAQKIFEPFYQLEMSGGRRKEGSGLGLSICKSIIEQHGGRIGFHGGVDSSVTFYFDLNEYASEHVDKSGRAETIESTLQTKELQ